MKTSELVDLFRADYSMQCALRGAKEINMPNRYIAAMISKTVSDIQKNLGVIEASDTITTIAGTATYSISSSFMDVQVVTYSELPIEKKSVKWIEEQYPQEGLPQYYAIQYTSSSAKLYLYPTPASSGDSVIVTSKYNYNLYSPSGSTSQDFGSFDGTKFSGNTVFPTQYDMALLLGMMKQVFKDVEIDYEKEISLLRVKQYRGEKFTYNLGMDTEEKRPFSSQQGVTALDIDKPWKYVRYTFTYGETVSASNNEKEIWGFTTAPTLSDNGSVITITSSGDEFTTPNLVEKNNDAVDVNVTDTGTITVNYFGSDYGVLTIIVKIW